MIYSVFPYFILSFSENGTANDKAASAYLRALRRGEAGHRNKPSEPWGVNVRGFTDSILFFVNYFNILIIYIYIYASDLIIVIL